MRQPDKYSVAAIKNWSVDFQLPDGRYTPCRPVAHNVFSFRWRFKLAWMVLIGRADALTWEAMQ